MARKQNEFPVPADKRPLVVKAQRDLIRAMADHLESGKPFARTAERKLAADTLRQWAKHVPDDMPEYVDPAQVAIHFACLVNLQERTRDEATGDLAEVYSVPPATISVVLEKYEEAAMRLVPKRDDAANPSVEDAGTQSPVASNGSGEKPAPRKKASPRAATRKSAK